jgi:hypothetical protein
MFNPGEFLSLAKTLSGQANDEKVARTCIARAYYAAHLSAREKIRPYFTTELQDLARTGESEHKFVRNKLIERSHSDISSKLLGLHRQRTRADYILTNYRTLMDQRKEVNNAILLCENILQLLGSV